MLVILLCVITVLRLKRIYDRRKLFSWFSRNFICYSTNFLKCFGNNFIKIGLTHYKVNLFQVYNSVIFSNSSRCVVVITVVQLLDLRQDFTWLLRLSSGTCCTLQAILHFVTHLPSRPECWDYRHMLPCLHRILSLPSKSSHACLIITCFHPHKTTTLSILKICL